MYLCSEHTVTTLVKMLVELNGEKVEPAYGGGTSYEVKLKKCDRLEI